VTRNNHPQVLEELRHWLDATQEPAKIEGDKD
jgi:hypothetical protein